MTTTVAIVSGGMDSVALAYLLSHEGHNLHLLSVDYGQRHAKEIDYARRAASDLACKHSVVDLRSITKLIATSSLTGAVEVPDGHYAEDTMRATVVPNRNMTMLSIACAVAISEGANYVATGVHGGDHFIYPDCRPEFVAAANAAALVGMAGVGTDWRGIIAPFVHHDKAYIAREGTAIGVPWQQTWSCYKGGEVHCGRCGTCVERAEAFHLAGVPDPTVYEDADYWRGVCGVA